MLTQLLGKLPLSFFRNKKFDSAQFLFILGTGRNGSSLLSALLNNNQSIYVAPEQYQFAKCMVLGKLNIWNNQQIISHFYKSGYNWNTTINKEKVNGLKTEQLLLKLYQEEAHFHNKKPKLIGDKTPHNLKHFKTIAKLLPNSNFIFLIRNPLDCFYSFKTMKTNNKKEITAFAEDWKATINNYKWAQQKGFKTTLVTYEQLVSAKKLLQNQLESFIKIPLEFESVSATSVKQLSLLANENHENINKPIFSNHVGRGAKKLTNDEVRYLKDSLGDYAKVITNLTH